MPRVSHLVACFALLLTTRAEAEPTLTHAVPSAVAPHATTEVVLHGNGFTEPLKVWTSFKATVEVTAVEAKKATISITPDASVGVGPAGLLVATAAGSCEPIVLLVDDLPSLADNGANHSPAQAQEIPPLCAVDGTSNGAAFDYYRFTAAEGQRIAVDVLARRINSTFDPVVRLLDEAGNELLAVDDDPALGPDCRFSHTFAAAGNYLLELRDSRYSAGGRYRLRIGDFPLVNTPLPLAARIGETSSFAFSGPDAAGADSGMVAIPADPLSKSVHVGAKYPDGQSSSWAEVAIEPTAQFVEAEPNDDLSQATPVEIPCGVSGQLQATGDRDTFEFTAAKGQAVRFAARTHSLGSPTLLVMRLFGAEGNKLAETPVNDADEWSFDYTFPADGLYRLQVEDLLRRGGPEHSYHVAISSSGSFTLMVKNDKAVRDRFALEPAAGACAVDLQITRFGYEGTIELSLVDAPAGLKLLNPLVPAAAKDARLLIAADATWPADALATVRVAGRAADVSEGQSDSPTVAESIALLRTRTPHVTFPAAWRDGLISLAGVAASEPFFAMKVPEAPLNFARPLGQASVELTLERKQAEFKDAVTVLPEPLPAGFAAAVKVDKDQYTITVTGPKETELNSLPLRLAIFGDHKLRGRVEFIELPVRIVDQ